MSRRLVATLYSLMLLLACVPAVVQADVCPDGSVWNGTTCVCPSYTGWDQAQGKCVSTNPFVRFIDSIIAWLKNLFSGNLPSITLPFPSTTVTIIPTTTASSSSTSITSTDSTTTGTTTQQTTQTTTTIHTISIGPVGCQGNSQIWTGTFHTQAVMVDGSLQTIFSLEEGGQQHRLLLTQLLESPIPDGTNVQVTGVQVAVPSSISGFVDDICVQTIQQIY